MKLYAWFECIMQLINICVARHPTLPSPATHVRDSNTSGVCTGRCRRVCSTACDEALPANSAPLVAAWLYTCNEMQISLKIDH